MSYSVKKDPATEVPPELPMPDTSGMKALLPDQATKAAPTPAEVPAPMEAASRAPMAFKATTRITPESLGGRSGKPSSTSSVTPSAFTDRKTVEAGLLLLMEESAEASAEASRILRGRANASWDKLAMEVCDVLGVVNLLADDPQFSAALAASVDKWHALKATKGYPKRPAVSAAVKALLEKVAR